MTKENDSQKTRQRKTSADLFNEAHTKIIKALELRKQELFDNGVMAELPKIQELITTIYATGNAELSAIKKIIGG